MKKLLSFILAVAMVLSMAVIPVAAADLPSAPTSLKAVPAGKTSVTLTWSSVSGADGYGIYRSTSKDGTYTAVKYIDDASATTYKNVTGLTEGTTYYYKMRSYILADGAKQWGSYSAAVSVVPSEVMPKPTGLKATSAGTTKIALSWDEISGADGYTLYRASSSTGTYTAIKHITSGSTTSYTNATGLETGRTYYYKVAAYNLDGTTKIYGEKSSAVSCKPLPAVPSGFKAESAGATSVKLTWNQAGGADGYGLYRATSKDGTYSAIKYIDNSETLSYKNASGLTEGNTYYYKIRSYVLVDGTKVWGSYSSAVSATPEIPLTAPLNLKAVPTGTTKIALSWSAVKGADGYTLYRATSADGTYTAIKHVEGGATTSYTNATGLSVGSTYYYKVAAYRLKGTTKVYGPKSSEIVGKTAKTMPSALEGFTAERASSTAATLSWKKVSNADGYAIYRSDAIDGKYTVVKYITSPDTLTYKNVTGMEADGVYYFKVCAYTLVDDIKVFGPYSPTKEVFLSGAIRIDEDHFPDEKFRNELSSFYYDKDSDGILSFSEIENLTSLYVSRSQIESLKGIEYFFNMNFLHCEDNFLLEIDLSKNTKLIQLSCRNNYLLYLDLSNNTELTILDCNNNLLTSLDLVKNTKLEYLNCGANLLESLVLGEKYDLEKLYCYKNYLTSLDVSKCKSMTLLNCSDNYIESINLKNNTKLIELDCSNNAITSLDTSLNTALRLYFCNGNKLSSINVSKNKQLQSFDCESNNLSSIDISLNSNLNCLNCSNNNLTKLVISKNPSLTVLYCSGNKLTALDISRNDMRVLDCSNNSITSLNLSNQLFLEKLHCYSNKITKLNISDCMKLKELYCDETVKIIK